MPKLVYVLPVHNEEALLASNVERLVSYLESHLERFGPGHVFLVENGSVDLSWEIAQSLARAADGDAGVRVAAFREPQAGIGYAYHRGLSEALTRFGASASDWAILTASDLPFGFTDLEAAAGGLARSTTRIMMGSKAHPESVVSEHGLKRSLLSLGYRVARRAMVGMRVGDSQGSVFVRLDLAAELLPKIRSRGFFYSTELCHYAERTGETIHELPVVLEPSPRASTVKPLEHGLQMGAELWRLRRRG